MMMVFYKSYRPDQVLPVVIVQSAYSQQTPDYLLGIYLYRRLGKDRSDPNGHPSGLQRFQSGLHSRGHSARFQNHINLKSCHLLRLKPLTGAKTPPPF